MQRRFNLTHHWLDKKLESGARQVALRLSRRSFITKLGALLVGTASFPLLPISRVAAQTADLTFEDSPDLTGDAADPKSCDYWRHCAIDGFISSCCGGTTTSCPPGTEMSAVSWIGTCTNPADGHKYLISYNDCCGKSPCGRCHCNENESDRPIYVTPKSNDVNWCMAAKNHQYNSTVALVLGIAEE